MGSNTKKRRLVLPHWQGKHCKVVQPVRYSALSLALHCAKLARLLKLEPEQKARPPVHSITQARLQPQRSWLEA